MTSSGRSVEAVDYSFELWAVDLGGQEQLVEKMEFHAIKRPSFRVDTKHSTELITLDVVPAL